MLVAGEPRDADIGKWLFVLGNSAKRAQERNRETEQRTDPCDPWPQTWGSGGEVWWNLFSFRHLQLPAWK
jgi:hypothetical protein